MQVQAHLKVADWANFDMTKITEAQLLFQDYCFDIYNARKTKRKEVFWYTEFHKILSSQWGFEESAHSLWKKYTLS